MRASRCPLAGAATRRRVGRAASAANRGGAHRLTRAAVRLAPARAIARSRDRGAAAPLHRPGGSCYRGRMARPSETGRCAWRSSHPATTIALALPLAGCGRAPVAPTFTVFGSFFPAWIVCALAGLVATLVTRAVFVRIGLDEHLPVRLLVYAAATVLWAVGLWFYFFAGVTP